MQCSVSWSRPPCCSTWQVSGRAAVGRGTRAWRQVRLWYPASLELIIPCDIEYFFCYVAFNLFLMCFIRIIMKLCSRRNNITWSAYLYFVLVYNELTQIVFVLSVGLALFVKSFRNSTLCMVGACVWLCVSVIHIAYGVCMCVSMIHTTRVECVCIHDTQHALCVCVSVIHIAYGVCDTHCV